MLIYFIFEVLSSIIKTIILMVVPILLLRYYFYSCFHLLLSSVLYSCVLIKYFLCFYHFIQCNKNSVTHPLFSLEEHCGPRDSFHWGWMRPSKGGRFGGETSSGRYKQLLEILLRFPIYSLEFVHRVCTLIIRILYHLVSNVANN